MRPTGLGGPEGDWAPEPNEGLRPWRQIADRGEYVRVRQLSPDSPVEDLCQDFSWRHTPYGLRMGRNQPDAHPAVKEKFAHLHERVPRRDGERPPPENPLAPIAP